jgi:hypothetical protein
VTNHTIEVLNIEEQEDGASIITFDIDDDLMKKLSELGLRFTLYCAAVNKTTTDVLNDLIKDMK